MNKGLSIVVPLHNEEEVAGALIAKLKAVKGYNPEDLEIILVDDGSTDNTLNELKEALTKYTNITVVELSYNHGQTAALAAGINYVTQPLVITMDGDLQHDPADIPRLLAELDKGFDMVLGWRKIRTDGFFLRRVPSKIANWMMRKVSGINVKDFGTAYRASTSEALKNIELFGELHRFVPVLAARNGAKISEVPITVHPRTMGKSKYGISRTIGVFQDIIFLEFYLNFLTKPIRAFGKLAFIFFGAGFLLSALLVALVLFGAINSVLEHEALLIFSVFIMIVGVQLLGTGILAELIARIHYQSSGRKIFTVRQVYK